MRKCHHCGADSVGSVMLYKVPGQLCMNRACNYVTGLAAFMAALALPFISEFRFIAYEGSYWAAIWRRNHLQTL